MIEKLKSRRVQCAGVLFALFFVQMVMHLNVDNILLDDWVFFSVLDAGNNPIAYLAQRWQTWSSRLIIEGVLVFLTHSIWAFRVLDSAAMVLMAWSLCRLAGAEEKPGMLAIASALVTTIPFAVLRSTGWMATSLNYYWPLAATLTALIPLADALWGRKTGKGMLAAAIVCAVFGANQEQTSAVIMGSSLVLGAAVMLRDKRVMPSLIAIFAIGGVELLLHLTCPGNALRAQDSIALVNLRDYGQFSLIDKLSIGLTSTTALLLFTFCPVLLACASIVAATVVARRRGVLAWLLMLPVAEMLYLGWQSQMMDMMSGASGLMELLRYGHYNDYVLQLGPDRIDMLSLIAMFRIVVVLGLMALALYLSIGHRPLAAVCVFVFAVGFAARMALSLSPTVVESGERTMLPLYGAMMLCSLLCLRGSRTDGSRRWPLLLALAVLAWAAGANIVSSFALAM